MTVMWRLIAVIFLASVMLFPGVEVLRFLFADVLGIYQDMSLTDCLLFFVIMLLCALLLQRRSEETHLRAVGNKPVPKPVRNASHIPTDAPITPRRRRPPA
ncbi:MAG: hypothetical protein ACUVX8_03450 [Candidatus Zipacnadales bacterium]